MRTDLGTWRGPQAQAVVRVLTRAGLAPEAEDTVGGTRITVPEDQNDAAHQVLVGAMDDIARAAGSDKPSERGPRRTRARGSARPDEGSDGPLVSERLLGFAPLVGLLAALLVAAMIPPGAVRTTVFVFALVGFGIVWARRHDDGSDDDYRHGMP